MAGNPFSARASFQVQDPNVPANALLNAGINLEQTNRRNFQSGLNNAVVQANQTLRQQMANEAQMARLLQQEDFAREERLAEQAFTRQQQADALKRAEAAKAQDFQGLIQAEQNSLSNSKNLFEHKSNLNALRAQVIDSATKGGNLNSDIVKAELDRLDRDIQATDVALGLNEQQRAQITAGISGINGEDPVAEQTTFESAGQGAFTSPLLPDEQTAGLSPITEELTSGPVDPEIQGLADSLKLTFNEKKAETLAKLTKNQNAISGPVKVTRETVTDNAREILGQEPTEEEVTLFKQQDEVRDELLKSKTSAGDYRKKLGAYNDNTFSLFTVDSAAADLDEAITTAQSNGVKINLNAQSTLRALLDKTIDSDDNEGAQELLNKIRAVNIFKFPKGTSPEAQQALKNKYLTALDQITGSSSFIARGAGNTGVLTAKDVQFAMKRYISLNGDIDQFLNNLDKGRADTAASQMRQGYLYHNDVATKEWKNALDDLGYKVKSNGTAEEIDPGQSLQQLFNQPQPALSEESEIFKKAPKQQQNILRAIRTFKQGLGN